MSTVTISMNHVLDLEPSLDGKAIISHGICYDNTLAVLVTDQTTKDLAFGRHAIPDGPSFPLTRSDGKYEMSFLRFDHSGLIQKVELPPSTHTFPFVQLFPNNEILVTSCRCRFANGKPELNASVYNEHGELVRQFCLGDGINKIQISRHGEIWVGYFDEGVFGNFGWDEPMGSAGLCCFDDKGKMTWSFEPPAGLEHIADCYAMTVGDDDVWMCYYTSFSVVQINKKKQVKGWNNKIAGANAIASDGYRVLLYGGYSQDRNRCVVQTLRFDGALDEMVTCSVEVPGELEKISATGRGRFLHFLNESNWYQFDVSNFGN